MALTLVKRWKKRRFPYPGRTAGTKRSTAEEE
jgi:hypothetical protein